MVFGRRFWSGGAALSDAFFGEAHVNEVSLIPEPSVYAAGMALPLFLLLLRRRFSRQKN